MTRDPDELPPLSEEMLAIASSRNLHVAAIHCEDDALMAFTTMLISVPQPGDTVVLDDGFELEVVRTEWRLTRLQGQKMLVPNVHAVGKSSRERRNP